MRLWILNRRVDGTPAAGVWWPPSPQEASETYRAYADARLRASGKVEEVHIVDRVRPVVLIYSVLDFTQDVHEREGAGRIRCYLVGPSPASWETLLMG